jgi:hypothetical protein
MTVAADDGWLNGVVGRAMWLAGASCCALLGLGYTGTKTRRCGGAGVWLGKHTHGCSAVVCVGDEVWSVTFVVHERGELPI